MKNLNAKLLKKESYITENYNEDQYEETLKISKDNVFIALDYTDQNIGKKTNLKLLVFQNEKVFDSYHKWISEKVINEKKALSQYHFFAQKNFISNTFLVLLTPKTEYNYFMGENKNLILKKMDKIEELLKTHLGNDIKDGDLKGIENIND